jgi:hypothetical protein
LSVGIRKRKRTRRLTGNLSLERGGGGGDDLIATNSKVAREIIPS